MRQIRHLLPLKTLSKRRKISGILRRAGHITLNTFRETRDYLSVVLMLQCPCQTYVKIPARLLHRGKLAFVVDNHLKSYNHYPVTVPPIHKKTKQK